MKNKLLLFLAFSFLGIIQSWGQETLNCPEGTIPNGATQMTFSTTNFSIVHAKGNDGNFAAYSPWRVYTNNTVTFTGGANVQRITSIVITATSNSYATAANGTVVVTSGTGSASISVSSATVTISTTGNVKGVMIDPSAQTRWSSLTINYELVPSDYYWDTSNITGLGGSAVWGTTFTNSATGNTTLITAPTTAATVFQGTAGTVTLNASQTVASSTFNVDGYTLATSGAGTKTLAGTVNLTTRNIQFNPISGADLTLSGIISGTGTASSTILTKNGAGTLTLGSAGNTFTGKVLINEGYIATTGESRFGANPSTFTADQITLNGGGISSVTGDITFSSNRGITLGTNGGKFNPSSGRTITLTNVVSGAGGLTKEGAGTVTLSGNHTYTGSTTITAGILQLSAANRIANTSNIILNGGTFRTGASAGYAETVGTLDLKANSTIALGTGIYNLNFANSNSVIWNGATLTITGWSGTERNSGTAGKIFVGNDATGLSTAQLAKITFAGFTNGTMILPTGEIVPGQSNAPYFEIESISGTTFGSVCANSTAATDGVFELYGYNLTTDNVTIGPLSGYTFSIDGNTFSNSLTITPVGGELAETIRIRFTPTAGQSYNGTVSIGGGGVILASTIPVTATGIANNTPALSIAITTGTNPECSGGTVIFTASSSNTSNGVVTYQWKLNGENVGINSITYTSSTLADNDIISCETTIAGGTCMLASTASSNIITMTVNTSPDITTIKPASGGPVGTLITITGSGFTAGSTVKFGNVAATEVQVISSTEIQTVIPDGAVSNAIEVSTALSCPSASTFAIINQDASDCN